MAPASSACTIVPGRNAPVLGKVRYMNAEGLERRFDMAAHLRAVDHLVDAERG
jgi:hypothetical protein